MELWQSSFLCVSVGFWTMVCISWTGVFDNVELEIGLQHYAEGTWFPFCPIMPLNTLINFGYIWLGVYWCWFTQTATLQGILKDNDSRLFFIFNIMAVIYGFVQLLRITTQTVLWSVLDQWCTLPFFSILLVWGLYLNYGWSNRRFAVIILLSMFSYVLTLFSTIGFEIMLGLHILAAVTGAMLSFRKYPSDGSLMSFFLAIFCCLGFVLLKLMDHHLAYLFTGFNYVSGHFLSKICDIYQIYFVNDFFLDITLEKAATMSVDDKTDFVENKGEYELLKKNSSNDIKYENPLK